MKRTLALLALVAVAATSCGRAPTDVPAPEPQLKLYSVPHGLATEVRNTILEALRSPEGQPSRGRASLAPGGRVMVLAPPLVHAGVENLLSSLASADAEPVPSTIEITYWVVAGRPATGEQPALPNALREVEAALSSTADALDLQEFTLIERLQLSSRSDARASSTGAFTNVSQRAYPSDGQIIASLKIDAGRASLDTEVKINEGQTVVLAQSTFGSKPGNPQSRWPAREGDIIFYIIRAVGRS